MPNIVPNTRVEPAVRDLIATRTIGAYVGVPVTLADGRVHGTLCCASSQPQDGLGDEELRFMQVLAGIIASRVDQAEGDVARLLRAAPVLRERFAGQAVVVAVEAGDVVARRAAVVVEPPLRGGVRREVRAVDLRYRLVGPPDERGAATATPAQAVHGSGSTRSSPWR